MRYVITSVMVLLFCVVIGVIVAAIKARNEPYFKVVKGGSMVIIEKVK